MYNTLVVFVGFFAILQLQRCIRGTMVVTMFEDKTELRRMVERTERKACSNYPDPLRRMHILEKIKLWERILDSTFFARKGMKNGGMSSERILKGGQIPAESTSTSYSYRRRLIYFKDEQTSRRYTIMCLAKLKGIAFKDIFHIIFAYRPDTYFIGEDYEFNRIVLVGIAEPSGVSKVFASQRKLEAAFTAQILRSTAGSGSFSEKIYQLSSKAATFIGMAATNFYNSTTRTFTNVCDLSVTGKVRLCGQVFASELYRENEVTFYGRAENVRSCDLSLRVFFQSYGRSTKADLYKPGIGCLVSERGEEITYYVTNAGEEADGSFDSAVFVFQQFDQNDDERKVYLDSYITDVTVLIPDD